MAVIVAAHVFGVRSHRYAWGFDQAVRNGYGGFLLFHTALLAINAALFIQDRYSVLLHRVAFAIVSMGNWRDLPLRSSGGLPRARPVCICDDTHLILQVPKQDRILEIETHRTARYSKNASLCGRRSNSNVQLDRSCSIKCQ